MENITFDMLEILNVRHVVHSAPFDMIRRARFRDGHKIYEDIIYSKLSNFR